MDSKITTIDEYIAQFDLSIQKQLTDLRTVIKEVVPDAQEKISWNMPTFYLNGNLVHFAAHKNHIGFYPSDTGISAFREKLTKYRTSKGAIQFPFDHPIPYDLIREIVSYRVQENKKI